MFLSQFSKGLSERRLAFIDRNQELWLCAVAPSTGKSSAPAKHKLHTQVPCFVLRVSRMLAV